MLDPMSFAAGSAVVVVGKLIYDVATHRNKTSPSISPPPPPPLPPTSHAKEKIKVKIFVDDIQSVVGHSVSQTYSPQNSNSQSRVFEDDREPERTISTPRGNFLVSSGDLHRIKLRPTQTRTMDHSKRPPVNQSPVCLDCTIQKNRLRHVF
jgi:hypothetical protein